MRPGPLGTRKPSRCARPAVVLLCLLSAFMPVNVGLALEQRLVTGEIGQFGVAADRTPGRDTLYVGALRSGQGVDTVKLLRTTNGGQSWSRVWQTPAPGQSLSNLTLRVAEGAERWVFLFWISDDGRNNGDPVGARVRIDNSQAQFLSPSVPGLPDTIDGLAFTRSFGFSCTLHLFWQDEAGRVGPARDPVLLHTWSSDYGLTWALPLPVISGCETPSCDYGAPKQLFLVGRSIQRQNIRLARSIDGGQSWTTRWITSHDSSVDDRFPVVASTHDSAADGRAWICYDSYDTTPGNRRWQIRYAWTRDGGVSWDTNNALHASSANELWSRLDCAGFGSRYVRVTYISNSDGYYKILYKEGDGDNPQRWSSQIEVSPREVSDAVPPIVADYGSTGTKGNNGIVLYCEPGPMNLWVNVFPFAGIAEASPGKTQAGLKARFDKGVLTLDFALLAPGRVEALVYDVQGRRVWGQDAGWRGAGRHLLKCSVPELNSGTYIVILRTGTGTLSAKLAIWR